MAAWDVWVAARRAWAVVLIGLLATLALVWRTTSVNLVYSAEMRVTLVAPSFPGALQEPQRGLIVAAALTVGRISVQLPGGTATEGVSLIGEGVRHGYSVTLRNRGGQWVVRYDRPDLRVQAVGATPHEVRALLGIALGRINEEVAALQAPLTINKRNLIRAVVMTPTPEIISGQGSATRATAAALALGVALTMTVVVVSERRLPRARRTAAPSVRHRRTLRHGYPS